MTDYLKRFEEICEKEINPKILPFEVLRQRMLKKQKFLKTLSLFLLFFTPFTLIILSFFPSFFDFLCFTQFVALAFGCIFLYFSIKCKNDYQKALKKNFLPIVMPIFGNLKYLKGKKIISDEEIIAAGFFNACYTTRCTEEAFIGKYKGYNFKICEDVLMNHRHKEYRIVHKFVNVSVENIQDKEKNSSKMMSIKKS